MTNSNIKRVRQSELELKEKVVAVNRVAKVTKGGRTFTFTAIGEVTDAIQKAIEDAKKNLIKVPILHGTVPHEQYGKFGGGNVFIKPASHGTGVIAGGAMRAVLESAGVHDVLAKSKGSSNPHNVVKATLDALSKLRDPYSISKQRNINLKQVFNG